MSKKKIAKFGLTAAVAATTVVAATPADAASVSATEKAVKQAAQSAGALVKYYSSTDIKVSGEFVTANNNARKAIANAKAALAKYNGKDKAQHEATVAKAEGQQLDAARYIDAEKLVKGELVNAAKAVDAHVKAQTLGAETVTAYNKLSDTIKKAERVIGKVRGEQVRKAFGDKFLQDAKLTREALIYEVSQYQLLNKIAEKVAKEDFNGLDAELDKLDRLEKRAGEIKDAGRKLYPGRTDVYPELPKIEEQLRSKETELRDKITKASPLPAVASVKAINTTTVEVAFKGEVKDIASIRFAIAGLDVKNAAVKQTDNKTIVITTSAQEGGKEYTLKAGESTLGKFKGVSAVIPSDITITTPSVQGTVGKEVTVKAQVTVKTGESKAGIPVTFNVKKQGDTLNKDHVAEVYTNADGVAEYTYTQYNGGEDQVIAYATGNASNRAVNGKVYWSVQERLTITEVTTSNTLANGSKKVYKVKAVDQFGNALRGTDSTGKVVNTFVNVAFAENVNVTPDKAVTTVEVTDATIGTGSGKYPYQYTTGGVQYVQVQLNDKGEATFTVTGKNASVTPIVFVDGAYVNGKWTGDNKIDASELQAKAATVKFEAVQSFGINVESKGVKEASAITAKSNGGRDYKVIVTDKDGKLAPKGTKVNVVFKEANLKANYATGDVQLVQTDADKKRTVTAVQADKAIELTTNDKGEVEFTLEGKTNHFATPIVFLETGDKAGLDKNDLQKEGEIVYFGDVVLNKATLKVTDANDKEVKSVTAPQKATFTYQAVDQNGKEHYDKEFEATFEIKAGFNDVTVEGVAATPVTVKAGKTESYKVKSTSGKAAITVSAQDASEVDVKVSASQTTLPNLESAVSITKYSGELATGKVSNVDDTKDVKTFTITDAKGKVFEYTYKNANYKLNGNDISDTKFESVLVGAEVAVTQDANGKLTFNVLTAGTPSANVSSSLIDADLAAVTAATIKNGNIDLNNVKTNLTLPTTGTVNGSTITWSATDVDTATIAPNGTVTRSAADNTNDTVVLTASATLNGVTKTKTFNVTILESKAPTITSVTNATLDKTNKTLVLTVVGADAIGDAVDVTKVTVKDADATLSEALTTSTGTVTSATTITINLSPADAAAIAAAAGVDVTVDVANGVLKDAAGNVSANFGAVQTGKAVTVTP